MVIFSGVTPSHCPADGTLGYSLPAYVEGGLKNILISCIYFYFIYFFRKFFWKLRQLSVCRLSSIEKLTSNRPGSREDSRLCTPRTVGNQKQKKLTDQKYKSFQHFTSCFSRRSRHRRDSQTETSEKTHRTEHLLGWDSGAKRLALIEPSKNKWSHGEIWERKKNQTFCRNQSQSISNEFPNTLGLVLDDRVLTYWTEVRHKTQKGSELVES